MSRGSEPARPADGPPADTRARRLARLGRILPVIGLILVAVPVLWHGPEPVRTSQVMLYIFAIWLLLTIAAWLVRRAVSRPSEDRLP